MLQWEQKRDDQAVAAQTVQKGKQPGKGTSTHSNSSAGGILFFLFFLDPVLGTGRTGM